MAGSVNKVLIVGNLGRDPEIRTSASGAKIANLSIATSDTWTDKASGEKRERTEWHRVVIFNERLAELAETYLRKGAKVYLEGQLATRKWTDAQGVEKYTTEVVVQNFRGDVQMLDRPGGNAPPHASGPDDYGSQSARNTGGTTPAPTSGGYAAHPDLDDEIPF